MVHARAGLTGTVKMKRLLLTFFGSPFGALRYGSAPAAMNRIVPALLHPTLALLHDNFVHRCQNAGFSLVASCRCEISAATASLVGFLPLALIGKIHVHGNG